MKAVRALSLILLGALLAAGCGEREQRLREVERYHEEMDSPDADVLVFTEQLRRWADEIAALAPELLGSRVNRLKSEALAHQETAYEFGRFFESARYETAEIQEYLGQKVELLARLQEILNSFVEDFLAVYRFSPEDEEALPGHHAEWINISCKNFTEAVRGVEGEFTRGRRLLLSQFILMGKR